MHQRYVLQNNLSVSSSASSLADVVAQANSSTSSLFPPTAAAADSGPPSGPKFLLPGAPSGGLDSLTPSSSAPKFFIPGGGAAPKSSSNLFASASATEKQGSSTVWGSSSKVQEDATSQEASQAPAEEPTPEQGSPDVGRASGEESGSIADLGKPDSSALPPAGFPLPNSLAQSTDFNNFHGFVSQAVNGSSLEPVPAWGSMDGSSQQPANGHMETEAEQAPEPVLPPAEPAAHAWGNGHAVEPSRDDSHSSSTYLDRHDGLGAASYPDPVAAGMDSAAAPVVKAAKTLQKKVGDAA